MEHIKINEFIAAVEKRAEQLGNYSQYSQLGLKEKAMAEATVYFLNKIIDAFTTLQTGKQLESTKLGLDEKR